MEVLPVLQAKQHSGLPALQTPEVARAGQFLVVREANQLSEVGQIGLEDPQVWAHSAGKNTQSASTGGLPLVVHGHMLRPARIQHFLRAIDDLAGKVTEAKSFQGLLGVVRQIQIRLGICWIKRLAMLCILLVGLSSH